MKKYAPLIAALVIGFAVHAQAQDDSHTPSVPPAEANAAPSDAAPALAEAESAAPKQILEVVGFVKDFETCGDKGGERSESYSNRASNAVAQISDRFGFLGTLTRMAVAGVAGSIVGSAVEAPIEERRICVKIGFNDGTPDQKLEERALYVKGHKRKDPVRVRFEDGKAAEFFFI